MLTGDALSVQLFIGQLFPAALMAALPLSGTQARLKWSLIGFGVAAGFLSLVWGPLTAYFPSLGPNLNPYLHGSWASLLLLMIAFSGTAWGFLRRIERASAVMPVGAAMPVGAPSSPAPAGTIFDNPGVFGARGTPPAVSWFHGTSKGNFSRLRLYVEVSHFRSGFGMTPTWTKPEPLLIAELSDVVRGQTVSVDLTSTFEKDGKLFHRWGPEGREPENVHYYMGIDRSYRGKVLASTGGDLEPLVSFISVRNLNEAQPNLLGEQLFDFA